MAILGSKMARVELGVNLLQKASSAKGKAAEKSPVEELAPADPATIDLQIQTQGDKVRQLKADKAPKVCHDS